MPSPTGRVLSGPPALCASMVEDTLNTSPDSRGGLGAVGPDRFQDCFNVCRIDQLNRILSVGRIDILFQ